MELDLAQTPPAQIPQSAGGRWVFGFTTQIPERSGLSEFGLCAVWGGFPGQSLQNFLLNIALMIYFIT